MYKYKYARERIFSPNSVRLVLSGSDDDRVVITTNERKRNVEKAISAFSVEGREQRFLDAIEENEANETTTRPIGQRCVLCVVHVT